MEMQLDTNLQTQPSFRAISREKEEVLPAYQCKKKMNRAEKKRWRSEKCAGGRGEHFTDNFLISGQEEICEKGRSERFQVEH